MQVSSQPLTREELSQEALLLVADSLGGLPRLASLLVALGHDAHASRVLSLQAELLGVVRPRRRRSRSQK